MKFFLTSQILFYLLVSSIPDIEHDPIMLLNL